MRRQRVRNWLPGLILVAPSIILILVFVYGLIGWNFKLALSGKHHDYSDENFVGLKNFFDIWHNFPTWRISVHNGLVFTAVFVGGALVLGWLLAFLMDKAIKGEGGFRAVYLFPMAISFIATGVVWRWLMAPAPGRNASGLNRLFGSLGLGALQNDWWQNPHAGMAAMALPAVWQMSGYVMALFLAGFRGVPEELREAARVDGATEWKVYRYVVLPQLRPVTLSAVIILGHISLKVFDLVYAINGKDVLTEVPAIFMWGQVYDRHDPATGATAGAYILVAVAVFVIPYLVWFVRSEKQR